MEDTRVTFETAKLAKEKGFFQETNRLEIPYYNYKGEFKGDVSDWRIRKYIRGENTSDIEFVSAPTQSLLAKWLREEYSIRVYPIQKIAGDFGFEIYIPNKDNPVGKPFERLAYFTLHFKTYEEAYEIGLQEALKLI